MEEPKIVFEKLTPFAESDIQIYEAAIDRVFEESDIRNVAISGAYSSGKSSVLESYKKKHGDLKFVHISLAHFQNPDAENTTVSESVLEGKILNQLIHQISAERIPQTNFRVKASVKTANVLLMAGAIAFCILAALNILYFDDWRTYIGALPLEWVRKIFAISTNVYSPLIFGSIGFGLICCFLYKIVKLQKTKGIFKKLNFQGNEIEIFEQTEDSFFDKYLNEVLYLFENVDADVIVFEDMDRFEANRIFERLREVNTLVNQQPRKNNEKVLRFFYLLRDDIFVSKDRTKFFDYIIPIVPVMDGSNSYNQFISHLKKNNLLDRFDKHFLQGISLYVDDMRLLKNICNEFLVYYYRLNTTELDYNKMLALIVYKNLFPRDFCELQLGKGFVYAIFANKDHFISSEQERLEEKIHSLTAEIEHCQKEHLETIRELDDAYAQKRTRVYPYSGQQRNRELQEISDSYAIRKQAIENKQPGVLERLVSQKATLEQELAMLQNCPLKGIITRENIDNIFRITTTNEIGKKEEYLEIKGSDYFDLLKYLIRNGYLDESYADYMTYFYEDSLSRTDKIFLRSVTDKKAKEYAYALKDPKLVLSRLNPLDFDQPEALNYCMLDYLLENSSDSLHLVHLVRQLKSTANYTFISQYYDVARSKTLFVIWINKLWPTFFKEAIEGKHLSPVQLKEYSVLTLCYSSDEEIASVNEENLLTDYVSSDEAYLNIEDPQIEKLLHAFRLLNVSFRCFAPVVAETELFRAVYRDGLYELNFENIQFMLQYQYHFSDTEDILHKNYSLVLTNMMSSLYVKTQENMSAYIDIILEKCGHKITDNENIVREVLNSDQVKHNQKEKYIMCVVNPIIHLKMVTDKSVWKVLVNSPVLEVNESNIIEYFQLVQKLDQDLVAFINRGTSKLDYSGIRNQYGPDDLERLFDAVVACEELSDQKYMECVVSLGYRYDEFNVANISSTKMIILIDNEIVEMNKATLAFIRKNYGKDVVLRYVLAHISDYADLVDENTFDYDELIAVLDSEVDDMYKLRLLELADAPISIKNRKYSVPVCVHILEHNLDENDMRTLFAQYDSLNVLIQNVVFNYAIKNMGYTTDNAQIIDTKLLQLIFESTDVSDEEKAVLLSEIMSKLNQEEISEYLVKMGMDNYLRIFDMRLRPRFEINDVSKTLLEAFKVNGWISEYIEDSEKPQHFRIRREQTKETYWKDKRQ